MSNKRLAKNQQIGETGRQTRERRGELDCRVYHLKLYPTKKPLEKLRRVFLEAKWLRNAANSASNFNVSFLKTVANGCPVKTPSGIETRSLTALGSQLKQAVLEQARNDIKGLSVAKKKGRKVGRLRYVSEVNSVNLQQYKNTYDLNWKTKRARIQNIGWVKVRGLHQLDGYKEIANAKLLQKPDGYYLAVTAYFDKGIKNEPITQKGRVVGIDMGVSTHLTLSDGRKIDSTIKETERLKRLQKKLARQSKGSNNRWKTLQLIRREYQKLDNRKKDFANKIARELLEHETVFFQDENLTAWKKNKMGRSLQHSTLGMIKDKLKNSERTVMLSKWVATTQYCRECGDYTKHSPSKRVFTCGNTKCDYTMDRDIHAALNMIHFGFIVLTNTSGTEDSACGGEIRLKDVVIQDTLKHSPMKQETITLSV